MEMCFDLVYQDYQLASDFEALKRRGLQVFVPGPDQEIGKGQYPPHARRKVDHRYGAVRELNRRDVPNIAREKANGRSREHRFFRIRRQMVQHLLEERPRVDLESSAVDPGNDPGSAQELPGQPVLDDASAMDFAGGIPQPFPDLLGSEVEGTGSVRLIDALLCV